MKILSRLALMLMLCLMVMPVKAQDDGLSEDDQALLDRVFAALDRVNGYASYQLNRTETTDQEFNLIVASQPLDLASSLAHEAETIVINQIEGKQIQSVVNVTYLEETPTGNINYGIDAEVRLLDGTIYVNSRYTDDTIDQEPLPEGWVAFETIDDIPGELDTLNLDEYLAQNLGRFQNRELVAASINDIVLESSELEDGTPVDVITLTFEGVGLSNVFSDFVSPSGTSDNPFVEVLSSQVADGSLTYTITLNEDNDPLIRTIEFDLAVEGLDLSSVSDQFPPESVVDLTLTLEEHILLSEINTEFDPIEVPQNE